MEKLKIWDLEVGKTYRFYDGSEVLSGNIYIINEQGELYCGRDKYCKNKNGFSKSSLIYNAVINGYFTEIKKEIDWSKVPRGTKVQVRDKEEYEFVNMYFIKFCKNERVPFKVNSCFSVSPCLDDGFTDFKMEHYNNFWKYCRIHPEVQIPDDWYKEVK